MPAATNHADLIAITEKEFIKLIKLLDGIDGELAEKPFEDGISIKHVIGHRAHWTDMFFQWHDQGQKSGQADIPAKGYKWSQLKDYNAKLRADQANLNWDEVRQMLYDSHADLVAFIADKDDGTLYAAPMKGGGVNKWTTGRFAEASGASHYRPAAKYVRACLRG